MEVDALLAFACAFVAAAVLTPPVAVVARRFGAVDPVRDRGLAAQPTPLLGGVAILAGVLIGAAAFLTPLTLEVRGILGGAAILTIVGAVDDLVDLPPGVKLSAQTVAALIPVLCGVRVDDFTFPFVGRVELGAWGGPLTLLGLITIINVVNLSDGVDGLAAGVCAIAAATFAIIAFDLGEDVAGVLAAITAGAATGFLIHNFHPASIFMGDCGSNLLGLLLGTIAVEGSLKTNALIALVAPLVVFTVPFLDTGFVVAKRIKYRRPVYRADANHFHHRLARIGFSQRRTVAYLYAWTLVMAGLAIALRFVPYSESSGRLNAGWAVLMVAFFLAAGAASVYLVYVLEILKLRRFRARLADPETAEHEIDERVARDLETGEFPRVPPGASAEPGRAP